ncbi:MAG: Mor transcription activator family protein [Romboutsia sp.]|uniref:Mor transcription activator family protein n=1 Tax=Romboutsia sp. TaxID=1965302 RepID=UPI003F3E904B
MLEYLNKDDLSESLGDVVDVIGIDSVKELIKLAGGSSIYIPSENSVVKAVRNRVIKSDFNGSYREFSKKFGISEVQVRNIVNLKS